jgi:hypothetical protein
MNSLLQKVKSSNIQGIGHDNRTEILYVLFNLGGMYSYTPFTKANYNRFRKAKSKGEYFHKHIKNNSKYTVQKLSL